IRRTARDVEADRQEVTNRALVRGGGMAKPLLGQEPALGVRQHGPTGFALPRLLQGRAFASHRPASSDRLARSHLPPPGGREEPLVPGERFELPTNGLQNRCSTTELTRQINEIRTKSSRCVLTASLRAPAIAEEGRRSSKIFLRCAEPSVGLAVQAMVRA